MRVNLLIVDVLLAGLLTAAHAQTNLKDAFSGSFRIGAAINRAQIYEQDSGGVALIKRQFNSITPENVLKWELVHPQAETYDFDASDHYVSFGEANHMFLIGHTLVWHNQTPAWVFQDDKGNPLTRQALLERMRAHIYKVVGRYKGRIQGWDVVNEAIADDGAMRQTPWLKIIGEDYIEKAFQYAHEADPEAELYYNDYSLENEPKRGGALRLIARLQAQGIPIAAIGLQGHDRLDWPSLEQQDATIAAFAALGVKVNITELDIDVLPRAARGQSADVTLNVELQEKLNPYTSGLPEAVQQALARRYADLFRVFLKHRGAIARVTFWGVTDKDSWLNNWPVKGRTSYPLLFDRAGSPKPAFQAVISVAREEAGK
ncbi:MAG TPA: endo-1,4-beta-xylanase [Terriglobales bacterium]|nr:endo-1,4-beta-xylanase [Terriglobales bacterium]